MLIGIIATSIYLAPLMIFARGILLLIIIAFFAIVLGALSELVLCKIHWLKRHYIIGGLIIPLIAVLSVYTSTKLSNLFLKGFNLKQHDPLLTGLIFAAFLIIPFAVHKIIVHHKK